MNDPVTLLCPVCHQPVERTEIMEQSDQGPRLDFYQCAKEGCPSGKLVVMFERSGDHKPAEPGFVEREVARRGAFFPSDYVGGGMMGGGRRW